ncbi:AimR family lysis-lysogeny pheromone receptor [Halobacillus shinanisalinarum]|uniref:AimR family lysis-lysogeny pheromone receptor n=1 Tax=Halobacillus shinanisalinarum TaxID=2932258 RepID=A0ABY4GUN2_9BACI|nr:AimR family lysis-lysogeny pheromone receptor [Halobacillus shinanisalinarum]UOQ91666.1 AimR family lysis-lysogeny pheromone receptor [Halobacillus shinanisalinarum]
MVRHKVIEPSRLSEAQMNEVSTIYQIYHDQLRHTSSKKAAKATMHYCLSGAHVKTEDQLASYEFLYMNDYFWELDTALSTQHDGSEIPLLYRVLLTRYSKPLTTEDLKWLQTLSFSHPSLKCLHLFTLVYAYYDIKQYTGLDKYVDECYDALLHVNEPLFYYYMKLRFDELLFQHYWKTNNLLLAKKYIYKVLNTDLSPRKLSSMNHNLALCHLYEDYDLAIGYACTGLGIARENNLVKAIKSIQNYTIPFISAFHKRTQNITTPDKVEMAHLAIAKGDSKTGEAILSRLSSLTPFQECYLGLATSDRAMLNRAHNRFIKEYGDHFFAQLPLYYLERINNN